MLSFQICFFSEICNQLIAALNESFTVGHLSTSQCQATITLIEKKAKDKRFLKNWRPISFINVDAKIASKVLASRIKNILGSIVKCDQTAYVKGRYIGESIRLISDILEYTEEMIYLGYCFLLISERPLTQLNMHFYLLSLSRLDLVLNLFSG